MYYYYYYYDNCIYIMWEIFHTKIVNFIFTDDLLIVMTE